MFIWIRIVCFILLATHLFYLVQSKENYSECKWGELPAEIHQELERSDLSCDEMESCIDAMKTSQEMEIPSSELIKNLTNVPLENSASKSRIQYCWGCQSLYFSFPRENITVAEADYATFGANITEQFISGFTVCFWLLCQPGEDLSIDGTMLTLTDGNASNILSIHGVKHERLVNMLVNNIKLQFFFPSSVKSNFETWASVCLRINLASNVASFHVNGQIVGESFEERLDRITFPKIAVITFGNIRKIVPGHDNPVYTAQFRGTFYRLNIWNRPLSNTDIQEMFAKELDKCECIKGNALSMIPSPVNFGNIQMHGKAWIGFSLINGKERKYFHHGPWNSCAKFMNNSMMVTVDTTSTTELGQSADNFTVPVIIPSTSHVVLYSSLGVGFLLLSVIVCFVAFLKTHLRKKKKKYKETPERGITSVSNSFTWKETTLKFHNPNIDIKNRYETKKYDAEKNPKFSDSDCESNGSFSRGYQFKGEHIYAEIHPKFLPPILRHKGKYDSKIKTFHNVTTTSEKRDQTVFQPPKCANEQFSKTEQNPNHPDIFHYYTLPCGEELREARPPQGCLYELPMESTFVNMNASGLIRNV